MQESQSLVLTLLMISWGVITVFLAALVIYRGTLSAREDDQIFIGDAEKHYYEEQQAIIVRMQRLTRPIVALTLVWSVLLLGSAGVWMYQGFNSF